MESVRNPSEKYALHLFSFDFMLPLLLPLPVASLTILRNLLFFNQKISKTAARLTFIFSGANI